MKDRISNNITRNSVLDPEKKFSFTNSTATEPQDMHPADLKALLEKRGLSLAQISRDAGYSQTAAGRALRTPWPAVEQILAAAVDLKPMEIWPSRYDVNGIPMKYLPRRMRTVGRNDPTKNKTKEP
ncbi:MAG TPA: hypothetical protein DCL95_16160 [Rhodospirillaceae bacterium]|nr:hypothetical protein [Rhodospirillaceae bacterium]MAX64074.1 hypothetical protein [Rhodospirillaceae bacterium]MBB57332.1 hypothetical protein [Rhodospirillaceae bacterium]HAJ21568.1 hypothetical protein [Rhodospirillaceae bacterium]HBM12952.1 hypothetical protein [Rhodospirillaceae bacterium]|tara:strand:- start:739 stop:1116 length:378 start_codon:yes stop_codon:yes gene_type:complete